MMFKKKFGPPVSNRLSNQWLQCRRQGAQKKLPALFGLYGLVLLIFCGCQSLSRSLPAVNLQAPGWVLYQGQAVWKLPYSKRDIAGDVTVALGPEGRSFVQFSKTPFPLVIGQATAKRWQIEFPAQNKRYIGSGSPPRRAMWLYLPRVLAGKPFPKKWTWSDSKGSWRLANPVSGEALEGFFAK